MKNVSTRSSMNILNPQTRNIAFTAILLFALSGLISGFAVGAFIHPKFLQPFPDKLATPPIAQETVTSTPTTISNSILLAPPTINTYQSQELADGQTIYPFTAQARDKQGHTIEVSGVTCRLWLQDKTQDPRNLPLDRLKSPDTLQSSPLPGEVPALIFSSTTPQTQACNASGQGTWKYQIDPSVVKHAGAYYLIVLTDSQGIHYNWSWVLITIK